MASYNHSPLHCNNTVTQLLNEFSSSLVNVTRGDLQNLMYFCVMGYESQANEKFSKPLVWIGVYIAIASLYCATAMGNDVFLSRLLVKDLVPGKYFSLNAASITVISIAMKLTLDMTGSMPGNLDQEAKLGGLAFMCTMMANLIPSLASMDNKTLVANVIGLAILVITIIGNISIEIYTGVIGDHMGPWFRTYLVTMTFWYVAMLLLLLLVSTSTAIIIPPTKKILEFKYQVRRKALNDQGGLQQRRMSKVNELRPHVIRYWIMAKSGSPQFIMAGTSLAYTSTLICVINIALFCALWLGQDHSNIRSDYGFAIHIILFIQLYGIIIGTIALVSRCIMNLSYREYDDIIKIEGYSTDRLSEWKRSRIAFLSSGRRARTFVQRMKNFILSLCIGLHIAVVALCRITESLFLYIYVTLRKFTTPIASRGENIEEDLRNYVLYTEDYVHTSQRALKGLLNSMDRLIQKAEKQKNDNILKLLGKSDGFKGVKNFDSDQVPDLPSVKLNSWSLPVVTLTCIAIVVPGISEDQIDKLIDGVDEALWYTHLVEESFNSANEYENIHNTTMNRVWYEVKENRKWLANPMQRGLYGETPREILRSFTAKAEAIVPRTMTSAYVEYLENFPNYTFMAAHSMHRISVSILSKYGNEIELFTNDQFFQLVSSMIADILCACLTNIPQVIMMKCHSDTIEKREASVEAAVELLGRSTNILEFLEECADQLPSMDPKERASIDEWRLHLNQSVV